MTPSSATRCFNFMDKEYLGDSVYAEFDGYHIVLTTENGIGPTNTIALEPAVIQALLEFQTRIIDAHRPPNQT